MWHTLKTTDHKSFIHTQLKHLPTPPPPNPDRKKSVFDTDSYNSSLSRAFTHAKQLAYFNPDLQYLITFTYRENMQDSHTALYDIKQFLKKERRKIRAPEEETNQTNHTDQPDENIKAVDRRSTIDQSSQRDTESTEREKESVNVKYIYVFETQKRGAVHIHMIANTPFQTFKNKNGHLQLKNWKHGFTSVLHIKELDNNFKPYLYLFKYFKKAERVGDSFIHTSKNFDKIKKVDYADYIERLKEENALYTEDFKLIQDEKEVNHIIKGYYRLNGER